MAKIIKQFSRKYFYSLLLTLSILVLIFKIFLNVRDFRYISYGLDAPRSLAQVEELVGSAKVPGDISPRLFLPFLGAFEQIVFAVSPEYILLSLVIFSITTSLVVIYSLSFFVWGTKTQAAWATLIFALSLTVIQASSSVLFSFLFGPVILLLFIRFVYSQASLLLLFLVYVGGFIFYPSFLFVINMILLTFLAFKVLQLGLKEQWQEIRRLSPFFVMFPLILWLFLPLDGRLVNPSYRPLLIYLWRVFGLWLSKDLYPFSAYLLFVTTAVSALVGLILFLLPNHLVSFLIYLKLHLPPLSLPTKPLRLVVVTTIVVISLFLLWDLVGHLNSFSSVFREQVIDPRNFLSFQVASLFIGGELWREIFLPFAIVLVLAFYSVTLVRPKSEVILLLLIFPVVGTIASLIKQVSLLAILSNSRGFVLMFAFITILSAGITGSKYWRKSVSLFVIFLLFVLSFGVNLSPHEPINRTILDSTAWYRSHLSSRVLVISPTGLLPNESTEKYYSLSFLPTYQPFAHPAHINLLLGSTCPEKGVLQALVKREGYDYIYVEPGVLPELVGKLRRHIPATEVYRLSGKGLYNQVIILKVED